VKERLQKFMAKAGIASRRRCEKIILEGRVKVNGKTVTRLGSKIDPQKDVVQVDGKVIKNTEKKVYIMLFKPKNCVSTVKDQFKRKTVLDYVTGIDKRIYPVGRLDYDTEGLLLLTNDGKLTYKLTHPKHEIKKTYVVKVKGVPSENSLDLLRKGVYLEDGKTSPADVVMLSKDDKKNTSLIRITIHEGKNRQVKRMFAAINHPVIELKRTKIGKLTLGKLKPGQWRELTDKEIAYLKDV